MDRGEHEAVAAVVEHRRGEREPSAHVAERVVAHDAHVAQRVRQLGAGAGEQRGQVVDLGAQPADLLGLARHGLDERGRVAVGRQQDEVLAHPAEPQQRHPGQHEGEQRDDESGDDEGVADGRVEGHVGKGIRA